MKKLVFSVMLVAMTTLSLSAADFKVATVDMMKLVKSHRSYETNRKLLASTEKDYEARLGKFKEELDQIQAEGKKLAEEYKNPMLAAGAKTKLEQQLGAVQERYLAAQQKLRQQLAYNQQELSELEARLLRQQAEEIKTFVADFAKANGYDMIYDASAAIFAKPGYDVTEKVLSTMPLVSKEGKPDEGK